MEQLWDARSIEFFRCWIVLAKCAFASVLKVLVGANARNDDLAGVLGSAVHDGVEETMDFAEMKGCEVKHCWSRPMVAV